MCGCWEVEVNGLGTGQTVPLKANRGDTGKVHTRGSSGWSPGLSRSAGQVPSIAFLRKEGVQGVGLQIRQLRKQAGLPSGVDGMGPLETPQ